MTLFLSVLAGALFFYFASAFLENWQSRLQMERFRLAMSGFRIKVPLRRRWIGKIGFSILGFTSVFLFYPRPGWIPLTGAVLGFVLPWLYEKESKMIRNFERRKNFPDFLDLFALALSSGFNLTAAFKCALQYLGASVLRKELANFYHQLEVGRPFEEVLSAMNFAWRDPRLASVLALLRHGMNRGFPLQDMLFDQAESLRKDYLMELEKRAETAKVKLLFPIVFFIFPAVFIILFGALFLQYSQMGRLF